LNLFGQKAKERFYFYKNSFFSEIKRGWQSKMAPRKGAFSWGSHRLIASPFGENKETKNSDSPLFGESAAGIQRLLEGSRTLYAA